MNIFNRVTMVILLIFFIVISLVAIVNVFLGAFNWSEAVLKVFNPEVTIPWYVSAPLLLLVIAFCVALLMLEFYRRKPKIVKIFNVKSGKAMITIDTITHQIKDAFIGISGIKNLKTNILPKKDGIIINMLVEINQSINIPEKMTEIIEASKKVCTEKLNIKVIDTILTITNLLGEASNDLLPEPENKGTDVEKNVLKEISENKDNSVSENSGYNENNKNKNTDCC